ncbi:MAG: protein kinase [Alphaproteobacteria bacterium]|nr:protein kinase [Alphaproteobacteria bacterium]MCB9794233.1 protein kinase [Alphaproteobacteria bacterium]
MARMAPSNAPRLEALQRALEGDDPFAFERLLPTLGRPLKADELGALGALARQAATRGRRWSLRAAMALALVAEDARGEAQQAQALSLLSALGEAGTPTVLGSFAVGTVIGVGGMGEVRRGEHLRTGTEVAIKLLSGEAMASESARAALRGEVRAVAALDHPNVVALLDYGHVSEAAGALSRGALSAGSPYIVLELAHGGSLRPHCGRLPWAACRELLLDLLSALAHAHARDLVHRDLKPDNVLVDDPRDMRRGPRLTDFGLAGLIGDRASGRVAGTPAYMAPEQLRGAWREIGPWTDLYALGCLATALVTGEPLFGEDEVDVVVRGQLVEEPPPLNPTIPLPEGFDAWRRRLLRKAPADRFQRAADAAHALRALGKEAALARTTPAPPWREPGSAATFTLGMQASPMPPAPAEGLPAPALPPLPADWRDAAAAPLPKALRGLGLIELATTDPPLVGREAVRDALWRSLSGDAGQVVLLRGAQGLGRSRMGTWLLRRAHASGAGFTVHLAAGSGGTRMPRRQNRWQGLAGFELMDAVRREMAAVGVENPVMVAAFAELIEPGVSGLDFGGPEQRLRVGLAAMLRYTRGRRLVIFIDDAHQEPDLIELVAAIAGAPLPVTVVLSLLDGGAEDPAREVVERIQGRPGVSVLTLEPLSATALRQLLTRSLGLDPELAARVAERCGGNPEHALSLVGAWARDRLLIEGPEGLELRGLDAEALPAGLQDAWRERLSPLVQALGEGSEDTLAVAALMGSRLGLAPWRRACDLGGLPAPDAAARGLVHEGLAAQDSSGDIQLNSLGMAESLIADAARRGRLSALHAACAAALEGAEEQGRHLLSAGRAEEAAERLLRAARDAKAASEHRRVLSALKRLERALQAAGVEEEDPRQGEAHALRAAALVALGQHALALRAADRGLARAQAARWPSRPELLRLRGVALAGLGRLDEAEAALLKASAAARALKDAPCLGLSLYGLADARARLGRLSEAREGMEEARQTLQGAGLSTEPWVATVTAASLALQDGDLEAADLALWRGKAGLVRIGSPSLRAWLRVVEAQRARLGGEPEAAASALREARRLAHSVGSGVAALADLESARLLIELGQLDAARELLLGLDAQAQAKERAGLRGEVLALLALAELRREDVIAALAALSELEALMTRTHFVSAFIANALEWGAAESTGSVAARFAAAAGWVRGRLR